MARRVNTSFVFALAAVLVILTLALTATWYFIVRADPSELVASGSSYMAQGQYEKAAEAFGRALARKKNDVDLVLKYVEAINHIPTTDPQRADEYLKQTGEFLRHANMLDTRHPEAFTRLMEFYVTLGRDFGNAAAYTAMYDQAQSLLTLDPKNVTAMRYRGIALVNQMRALNLPPEKKTQALEDLKAALAAHPNDADVAMSLALWNLFEARQQSRPGGQPQVARKLRGDAVKVMSDVVAQSPQSTRSKIDLVLVAEEAGELPTARDAAAKVEPMLLGNPSVIDDVIDLAGILPSVDPTPVAATTTRGPTTQGLSRSETLLRAALKSQPQNQRLQFALAMNLQAQQQTGEALLLFKTAQDQSQPLPAMAAIRRALQAQQARTFYIDLLLGQAETSRDPKQRQALLSEADKLVEQLVAATGQTAVVNLLQSKIASLRDQWEESLVLADKAIAVFEARTEARDDQSLTPALLLSARGRLRLGQLGAAAERLNRLLELRPDLLPARIELSRVYFRNRQFADVQKQVDLILKQDPNNLDAIQLRAFTLSELGQSAQAIELLRKQDTTRHPELVRPLAQIYVTANQAPAAKQLLDPYLDKFPADLAALNLWAKTTGDAAQLKARLDNARRAGVPEQSLLVLQSQLAGGIEASAVIEQAIAAEPDPFRRHMLTYEFQQRQGKPDAAKAALAQAAKLKPDDENVITQQFNIALGESRFTDAQALADRAVKLNLDAANGAFFLGRLDMERGRYDSAAAHFDRGLKTRTVYSDGWRQLGDARRAMSDLAGATNAYQQAIDQQPENIAALRGLAMAAEQSGNAEQALTVYRKAVTMAPNDDRLSHEYLSYEQLRGDPKKALAGRQALAQKSPQNLPNRRALALLLAQQDKTSDAKKLAGELLAQLPNDRETLLTVALVHRTSGDEAAGLAVLNNYLSTRTPSPASADWQLLAQYHLMAGQFDAAVAAYQQAIKYEDPKLRPASRELADLLWDQQRLAQAVELYRSLYKQEPSDRVVADRFVESLISTKQLDEAETALKRSETERPNEARLLLLRSMLARARGDEAGALTAINKALEAAPNLSLGYFKRAEILATKPDRDTAAIADLNKALELDPNLGQARVMLASIYSRRGERSEAIRTLQTLLRRSPRSIDTRMALVKLYFDSEQWLPLRTLLEESAKLYPTDAQWPRLQARVAQSAGRSAESLPFLEKALQLDASPMNLAEVVAYQLEARRPDAALASLEKQAQVVSTAPMLLGLKGRALAMRKDPQNALSAFSQAIKLSQTLADFVAVTGQMVSAFGLDETVSQLQPLLPTGGVKLEIALAQAETEAARYDAALTRLRRVESSVPATGPERVITDRLLSLSLHQVGRFEEARVVYERMLKREPNDLRTLNNMAYLLTDNLNKPQDALPLAQRAAELSPGDPQVLDTLGWTQFRVGKLDAAAQNLELSVKAKPLAASSLHLAEVQLARGQRQAGLETLQMARRLAEDTKDAATLAAVRKRLEELGRK